MEKEIFKERFLGTIFGQAVGDALGLSTEFMSKQEVDRFYPNGIEDYSQIVQDDHRRRWQRGDYTSNQQKAAEIIWKMGKKKAAANGAVMRTSVVGLLKDNVANNAENICKLRSEP